MLFQSNRGVQFPLSACDMCIEGKKNSITGPKNVRQEKGGGGGEAEMEVFIRS